MLEESCRLACIAIGVDYKPVPSDGRWHLANITGEPRGKGDGRIKAFPDRQGGIVWNFQTGERQFYFLNQHGGKTLSPAERAEIEAKQRQRAAELTQRQEQTAARARALWHQAQPARDHPYLIRKNVQAHGARVTTWTRQTEAGRIEIQNALLVPMYNQNGVIRSLQAIFPDDCPELGRNKDFLPCGERGGLFWWIGQPTGTVLIAEGFSTAATLHKETGQRVYIAFAANNLMSVGKTLREKLPDAELIFCADNDTKTKGNPGVTYATQAAQAVGGRVTIPPTHGDFNDYFNGA